MRKPGGSRRSCVSGQTCLDDPLWNGVAYAIATWVAGSGGWAQGSPVAADMERFVSAPASGDRAGPSGAIALAALAIRDAAA